MKVKLKGDEGMVGEVVERSILNYGKELLINWSFGSYYSRKSLCQVSALIFVVPAKYRRLENA